MSKQGKHGCDEQPSDGPPNALPKITKLAVSAAEQDFHPSDIGCLSAPGLPRLNTGLFLD